MVELAIYFSVRRKTNLSDFFLEVTIPLYLVPSRKALYYWSKASNKIIKDPTLISEAYELSKKVNPDNIYSDHNKSIFFSFLAALHKDLGNNEEAIKYIEMSINTPHQKKADKMLEDLKAQITK